MRILRVALAALGTACLAWAIRLGLLSGDEGSAFIAERFTIGLGLQASIPPPSIARVVLLATFMGAVFLTVAGVRRWSALLWNGTWSAWCYGIGAIRGIWRGMAGWERWTFVALIVACTVLRIWKSVAAPALLDEALTGLLFVERGPFVALSWYPAPNNHIFYSLCASMVSWLPMDRLFGMRLVAVIAAGLGQATVHLLLRRYTGAFAALIGAGAFSAAIPMLYYDHLGRGYALLVFQGALCFGAASAWLRSGNARALHVHVGAGITGLLTMPSFAYFLTPLFLGLLVVRGREQEPRRALSKAFLLCAAGTLFAFAPALLLSGPQALVANAYVLPIGWEAVVQGWGGHWSRVFEGFAGMRQGWAAVGAVLVLAVWRCRGEARALIVLSALIVVSSLCIPFVHGVIPFERTWLPLLVPVVFALSVLVDIAARALRWTALAVPTVFVWIGVQHTRQRAAFAEHEQEAIRAAAACTMILPVEPKRVWAASHPLGAYVLFDLRRRGIPHELVFGSSVADGASGAFTALVAPAGVHLPAEEWRILFADGGVDEVWVRTAPGVRSQEMK